MSKLNTYDTAVLNNAMYVVAEVKDQLEAAADREGMDFQDLKPTVINTEILYLIVSAYTQAYESLMEKQLLSNSPKAKPTLN